MLKRLWYNESGFKGNCEKGSKNVFLGMFQRGIRMIKKVVIVLMFCLLLCGCTPAVKYKIEGANVNVQSIYFKDIETLVCSKDSPYFTQILEQIEDISGQRPVNPEMHVFVHDPDITLVATNDVTYEIGSAVPDLGPVPDGDGYSGDTYQEFIYIRKLKAGNAVNFTYYDGDEEAIELFRLQDEAIGYEFTSGAISDATGVVIGIHEEKKGTRCVVDSTEYGRLHIYVEDADNVIEGDMVKFNITSVDEDRDYYGIIENLTDNDVTQTKEEYLTSLNFEYYIMTVPKDPEMNDVSQGRISMVDKTEEDLDFTLSLNDDSLPGNILRELDQKYDEEFFEDHFLLHYGMRVTEAEVTAVVQQEWLGGDNYVYIKKLTDEEVPDTELKIIWIEVEKDRWDECGFYPYVYE